MSSADNYTIYVHVFFPHFLSILYDNFQMNKKKDGAVNSRYLEVDGTIFYKFKLPEVQINLHFGYFELVKKTQTPNDD